MKMRHRLRTNANGRFGSDINQGAATKQRKITALLTATCLALIFMPGAMAAQYKTNQVRVEYVLPTNSAHRPVYEKLKQARALERIRELLSSLRLPRPLPLRLAGCDGVANAWYDGEDGVITVCYEYIAEILSNAPTQAPPAGITTSDILLGSILDVFLHETGHAVFDLLKIPVFGREEDAADQFSAYIMLQFGKDDARRLILGSAYQYKTDLKDPQVTLTLQKFSDEHGLPAQRFYNVLCIAYGADSKLFSDVVEKGFLPKSRAEGCESEYEQTAFSFKRLIGPYIDKELAKKTLKTWMRDVSTRSARPPRR